MCKNNIEILIMLAISALAYGALPICVRQEKEGAYRHTLKKVASCIAAGLILADLSALTGWHTGQAIIHGEPVGETKDGALLLADMEGTFTVYGMDGAYQGYLLEQGVPTTLVAHRDGKGRWVFCEER